MALIYVTRADDSSLHAEEFSAGTGGVWVTGSRREKIGPASGKEAGGCMAGVVVRYMVGRTMVRVNRGMMKEEAKKSCRSGDFQSSASAGMI